MCLNIGVKSFDDIKSTWQTYTPVWNSGVFSSILIQVLASLLIFAWGWKSSLMGEFWIPVQMTFFFLVRGNFQNSVWMNLLGDKYIILGQNSNCFPTFLEKNAFPEYF